MSEWNPQDPAPQISPEDVNPSPETADPTPETTPAPAVEPAPVAPADPTPGTPEESLVEEPAGSTPDTPVEPVAEAPAEPAREIPADPIPETPVDPATYQWTYAGQSTANIGGRGGKRRGLFVFAVVMTAAFLVSFTLLALALIFDQGGSTTILRPGISAETDDEAVVGVEQAKHSVVVVEVTTKQGSGVGTGIILTEDGYVATNHHVIENATSIRLKFYDGTYVEAKTVGSSEMDDLAVLKVNRRGLIPATFARSEECYVGQTVYAIGTPAATQFAWTTTKGIISYKDREIKMYDQTDGTLQKKLRLLQTDANVNPGNSGGPLINTKGEVVGVVSMKLSEGYEGIGFAIPSDGAVEILEAIMKDGNADSINSSVSHKRPILGITGVYMQGETYYLLLDGRIQQLDESEVKNYDADRVVHPDVSGIYVTDITEGTDAAGKLKVGDMITAVQGTEFTTMYGMMDVINEYYAGDTVTLTVYRNGRYIPVDLVLSAQ